MADLSNDQNLPAAGDVSVVIDETQIPEAEREDILKEIESRVSESQTTRTLDDQYLRPQRSGIVFPIVINLIAAAAIAGGIYFISEYFRIREDTIALESRSYFSAEAQLIEEILRENEQRLAQKDQEIGQIQNQLALLDAEKQNLEANLEDQVAARETELRAQLDAELAAERARLAELGQSEEDIDARLQEIESQRQQEFASQLDQFRAEAQAELDSLAAELDARESQLEQTLLASQEERTRIADEAAVREAELREELGAEIEALEEAGQEAQARISELQSLREEESLLADRVLGSFALIAEDIQEGRSEEALSGLDSLERLLRDQIPIDTEAERQRRTELALASTLRSLVQEVDVLRDNIAVRDLTTTGEEETALEQQRAAELITTAAGVVQLAEDARSTGRINEARSLYQQALSTIPSLDQVYPGLLDLEARRRELVMAAALGEAQSLLAAGSSEAAVTTYLQALSDISDGEDDPLRDVAAGIQSATEQSQQDLLDAQQDLEDEYRADLTANSREIANLNQQLLASQNQVASRDASITALRTEVETLNQQLSSREASLTGRADDLEAAQARVTELEDQISTLQTDLQTARTRSASLQESLTAARDRAATLEENEASLESTEGELRADAAALRAQVETLTAERSTLQSEVTSAQQEIAALELEVGSLTGQTQSLSDEVSALEENVSTLEATVTDLRQELASRPATEVSDTPSTATQAEMDELNATIATRDATIADLNRTIESHTSTIAELNETIAERNATIAQHSSAIDQSGATIDQNASTIAQLNTTIEQREESISSLESQIESVRGELRTATNERDSAQTELEAAGQQISGLQDQIASLRDQRDTVSGESSSLEAQVEQLTEEVAILQRYRDRIQSLTERYESGQTTAARLAAAANYESARDRLLNPLQTETANEILPGLVTNLERIYAGLISQAENRTSAEVRTAALVDVAGLTEQVKKNIDNASESAAVDSYLRREPDIQEIADDIFEIIELASRDLSAAEVEYRLLGSVSRTTGNLVVVERLVALEPAIGGVVEIRRTRELGQEVPVALGTVIEVTDRRVVVSVDQIYELDATIEIADIVYLAGE